MRAYTNPFRLRASEQVRDTRAFVRHFGAGVLDLMPRDVWDRLFVIRSAPGGGKTSLMRLFTYESLQTIASRPDEHESLLARLEDLGLDREAGIGVFGVLLRLDRDYRALVDVGAPRDIGVRLFFRLLDARLISGVIRGALATRGLRYPDDAHRANLVASANDDGVATAAAALGGFGGDALHRAARATEMAITNLLDTLQPVDWDAAGSGHNDLHSLRLLSGAQIVVDETPIEPRPLILLDDGHELAPAQREELLDRLARRDLAVSRWYSERLQALEPPQLVTGSSHGRDYVVLDLEAAARSSGRLSQARRFRFERLLLEIGNLRAARSLERADEGEHRFSELVEVDPGRRIGDREAEVLAGLSAEFAESAAGDPRYSAWQKEVEAASGFSGAVRIQELCILVSRDRRRPTLELFDFPLGEEEAERLSSSTVRDAAELFICRKFNLPYYCGPDVLARVGSHNIEQFLTVSGDLFEQMLGLITLGKRPELSAAQQDRVVRAASDAYWRDIQARVPNGRDVLTLALAIARLGRDETYRPTAPYAPGVTGTAITMSDRDRLLDDGLRRRIRGGDRLYQALASAIAFNVISADLGVSVKGNHFMVLYLNRLLLPKFMLPLGRGGFRERGLEVLASWLHDTASEVELVQEPLQLGTD